MDWIKKLLSQFTPIKLETKESEFSGTLNLVLSRGRISLQTSNAIYSYEDLYINFLELFREMKFEYIKGKKVLILGMGMGSVPFILQEIHQKHFEYDLVEIDPVIIDMAQKYTLNHYQLQCNIHCTDAYSFVEQCNSKFDMIIVDLFIDDLVPEHFETQSFLVNLKKIMHGDTLLIFNRLSNHKMNHEKTKKFYEQTFKSEFPDAIKKNIFNNDMLLSWDPY